MRKALIRALAIGALITAVLVVLVGLASVLLRDDGTDEPECTPDTNGLEGETYEIGPNGTDIPVPNTPVLLPTYSDVSYHVEQEETQLVFTTMVHDLVVFHIPGRPGELAFESEEAAHAVDPALQPKTFPFSYRPGDEGTTLYLESEGEAIFFTITDDDHDNRAEVTVFPDTPLLTCLPQAKPG